MRTYVHDYGIGPWEIYEFNPGNVANMREDGKPVERPGASRSARWGRSSGSSSSRSTTGASTRASSPRGVRACTTSASRCRTSTRPSRRRRSAGTASCSAATSGHLVRVPRDRPRPRRDHGDLLRRARRGPAAGRDVRGLSGRVARMAPATVRDAAIEVFRARGLTRMFANPGSTEVPLLVDLPSDLEFVLGLHEGSVVGIATGWALGRDEPALVLLHTTAGLGNAVGALATARVNRAPLVVLVGQQDRRHLAHEPFLAGRLEGLAGTLPRLGRAAGQAAGPPRRDRPRMARGDDPTRPGARHRADGRLAGAGGGRGRSARRRRGDPARRRRGPRRGRRARRAARRGGAARRRRRRRGGRAARLGRARRGRGTARRSVWQEAFGARAGFPRTTRASRGTCRPTGPGSAPSSSRSTPFSSSGHRRSASTHSHRGRSTARAPRGGGHRRPGRGAPQRSGAGRPRPRRPDVRGARRPARAARAHVDRGRVRASPRAGRDGRPARGPRHVFSALARRLPRDAIVFEEAPSSKPELHARIAARARSGS